MKVALVVTLSAILPVLAQEPVDQATVARMRSEEMEHSQIMHTVHMLTDRYGPRVTGTPNHELCAKWAAEQMTRWGLKNAHLEPWEFGHSGWLNEYANGHIDAPVSENIKFEVLAWTPSTPGKVVASAIQIAPPEGPLPAAGVGMDPGRGGAIRSVPVRLGPLKTELDQWIAATQDKVRGMIVLVGTAAVVPVDFDPPAKRRPDDQVKARFDPVNPTPARGGAAPPAADPTRYSPNEANARIDAMLVAGGAAVRVNDAARAGGIIVALQNRTYDTTKAVPTVVLRNDDFGRVERLLADGEDMKLDFEIVNRVYPEGKTSYNTIAEIPGTDKASEVVMLGAHLDSWHGGTGATDNAIGCSIMMEAARLIQNSGVKPRRTIRVALWSGEEEGGLGSIAYVKAHFGSAEDPKSEFSQLDAYFNVDTGTGRLRGAIIFGPAETATFLRPVFAQFADWGFAGVISTSSRVVENSDHTPFNNGGLPGILLQQDPIEYTTTTHHTNLDNYERIVADDAQKAAAVVAAGVLRVANLDEMVPRFSKDKMPAPVKIAE